MTPRGDEWKTRARWIVGGVIVAALAACGWLVLTDAPAYRFLVRLYVNKQFLKHTLGEWGVLAPVIFIGLQVLQVVVAPIPGELTGILGGYLFGQWVGLLYSTIGLTVGSVAAFAIGRWLGARYVQKLVSPDIWRKMGAGSPKASTRQTSAMRSCSISYPLVNMNSYVSLAAHCQT